MHHISITLSFHFLLEEGDFDMKLFYYVVLLSSSLYSTGKYSVSYTILTNISYSSKLTLLSWFRSTFMKNASTISFFTFMCLLFR